MSDQDRSTATGTTGMARKVIATVLALATVLGVVAGAFGASPASATTQTRRVLIDTDLGGDPDDIQSLVRAIHYSDVLKVEGIVSTVGPGTPRPHLITEWIRRTDVDHLRALGHGDLMTEAALLATVKVGSQTKGAPTDARRTEGSRHIIARAHAGSASNPLWVLAWGSMTTIAQALRDDPTIAPKIRIYSIGDYNSTADLAARDHVLKFLAAHPTLWWVENGVLPRESRSTFRGVWRGGNQAGEWHRRTYVTANIRGHGTTAGGAFPQKLGDAFPLGNSPAEAVDSLKEGDSPSLLYLLSPAIGGIGNVDNPTTASWGGQFRRADAKYPNYYVDLNCATKEVCQATINRHRVAYLSDWKARWDRYNGSAKVTETVAAPTTSTTTAPAPITAPAPTTSTTAPAATTAPSGSGPVLTIGDKQLTESATGRWMTFTAELSKPSTAKVTASFTTVDGTATQGSDYKAQSGAIAIAAGKTKAWVNVWIVGDRTKEPTEAFTVSLTNPVNVSLADSVATGTIVNDD